MTLGLIGQGTAYGLISTSTKRVENSVKAGGNLYLTSVLQMAQGSKAIGFANKALDLSGRKPFTWVTKSIVYLTPPLLSLLKGKDLVSGKLRKMVLFLQDHVGALYQLASAVSSFALLLMGQVAFALPALLILGLGCLDQNGWLPLQMRQVMHQASPPILIATGLVFGSLLDKLFTSINLISWVTNLYCSRKKREHVEVLPENNLTSQNVRDFLGGRLHLQINPKHILCNPFPPVPSIDIQILMDKFESINWDRNISTLRRKLSEDVRYTERHGNPNLKTDAEVIAIVKNSFQVFISSIKERRILEGEPVDYEKLHNYLKIITKYVEDQSDEVTKVDILFRLAIEGGEYCGPGKFEVAESIYAQTLGENSAIPLKDKILHCLQDGRNLWMQKFYHLSFRGLPISQRVGQLIDWQDVHNYNIFLNMYGDEFGLRKTAAENDESAVVDPLSRLIMSCTIGKVVGKLFWAENTLSNQARSLTESIGSSKLPKPEVYTFWQNWIDRQQISAQEKESLLEELMTGRLFGRALEDRRGKMDPRFVELMLYDMGIGERGLEGSHCPFPLSGSPVSVS